MDALGWLIFLVALLVSVMLHESGHFVAAKRFGMKATRYFVGFGPTLWSTQRGETEYGIKAFPVGGFVKIEGMTSLDEVDPEDEPRSFRRAPGWQRLIVLAAGSFMHFVIAAVLIFGLALSIGIENDNTTKLGTVAACVPSNEQALTGTNFQRQSPLGAIKSVGTGFSQVISGSVSALGHLPAAIPSLFKSDRSATAAGNVSSVVGAARVTGQAVAANVGWEYKVSFVLLLIASLNIFVGLFNLLPLLPLDGGHIAVVIWERIKAAFARLRRKPDPGMVDYRKLVPVSFSIFLVLVVFGVMLILADIVNPVSIG